MLIEGKSFNDLDWGSVGVSALEGAASGALAAATGGASLAATAGKEAVKLTGKQIVKQAAKTMVIEGVAGAAINAGAQKVVKGEVDWTEVAISGVSDAVSGGFGSAIPNTTMGKKLLDAGENLKQQVKDKAQNLVKNVNETLNNVASTFKPGFAFAGGPGKGSVADVAKYTNTGTPTLEPTDVQKNWKAYFAEANGDAGGAASKSVSAGVSKADDIAHGGYYTRKQLRSEIYNATYTPHGNKHLKAKTIDEAKLFSETGRKHAQYLPGVNNKVLEKKALMHGDIVDLDKGARYFIYDTGKTIGYDMGKPTSYIRAELTSGGVYHGHPIGGQRLQEYLDIAIPR